MSALAALPLVLAFAILVCVPLALRAIGPGGSTGRLLLGAYPPAAIAGLLAIVVPQGPPSAALAAVWLAFTVLAALHGLQRASATRGRTVSELAIAAGFAYLAAGGAWFAIWRLGVPVADFGEHVPLLTAIHFHYAGFASPILAGFVGRELRAARSGTWPLYSAALAMVVAGPALVAFGIAGIRQVEAPAAVILASGTAGVAIIALTKALPRLEPASARALLAISASAALFAMALALVYAAGSGLVLSALDVETMARWHGTANALGYVLCGLLAWNIRRPLPG